MREDFIFIMPKITKLHDMCIFQSYSKQTTTNLILVNIPSLFLGDEVNRNDDRRPHVSLGQASYGVRLPVLLLKRFTV